MIVDREKIREQTEQCWPDLFQFLGSYVHQNWCDFFDSPEEAVDHAVSEFSLEALRKVRLEWNDWKQRVARTKDPRISLNDGFGVNVHFRFPYKARKFIKMVDGKIDAGIAEAETGKGTKN